MNGLPEPGADNERLRHLFSRYHPASASFVLAAGAVSSLAGDEFTYELHYGVARRAAQARKALMSFTKAVFPGRETIMAENERTAAELATQALYVNGRGLLDCAVTAICKGPGIARCLKRTEKSLQHPKFLRTLAFPCRE